MITNMENKPTDFFQNHMPENVCFGCGAENHDGLQIKSYWEGDTAVCRWQPEEKHHGWANLLNGGVMATLIDCHCMGTAMAHAYKEENRTMDSEPEYRYATGSMEIKYLKPTSNLIPIELRSRVTEVKGKKTVVSCELISDNNVTVKATVIAIRVYDSSISKEHNLFK